MQRRLFFPAAFAVLAVSFAFAACSNQGEGERCSKSDDNGGNDDCQSGLVCFSKTSLQGAGAQTDICCPPDQTQATTAICAIHPTPPNADAAVPQEAGGGDDAAADAADANAADANAVDANAVDAGGDSADAGPVPVDASDAG